MTKPRQPAASAGESKRSWMGEGAGLPRSENPARWRGHLDQLLPAKSKVRKVKHQPGAALWRDRGGS